MKFISPSDLARYSKEHTRFFDTGVLGPINSASPSVVAEPYYSFRVEEDEVLIETAVWIGHTSNDDAGYVLEGGADIADVPNVGVAQLSLQVNPIIYGFQDLHDHNYIVGTAGGYQKHFDGWRRFQFNNGSNLYLWEEDDRIYLNYAFNTDCTNDVGVHCAWYIVTAQRP